MESHKIYGKAITSIGLCMFVALAAFHLFVELSGASKQGTIGRVSQARSALALITKEPEELVFFFGSSMTRAGFSPRDFDRLLLLRDKQTKSFNFGFGGLNPYFQDLLSRRIVDEFVDKDRKLKLAMIEFNPFQTTSTRWRRAKPVVDSYTAMLSSNSELMNISLQDPSRGVRLLSTKYLRRNISAELVTTVFTQELFPSRPYTQLQEDDAVKKEQRRLQGLLEKQFDKEFPDYQNQQWSYAWRGAGPIKQERSEKTLDLLKQYYTVRHTDVLMQNDRLARIHSADIEELNFEPLLIEHFINIIKNFQKVSDNVEVLLLPKNSKWIKNTIGGEERLAEVIQEIELATGVKIKNHQNLPEITSDMYRDTTHLSRYHGDVAYTNYLIKEFAEKF